MRARETAALGRELLGGNGILSDFLVAKVLMTNYSLFNVCFVELPIQSKIEMGVILELIFSSYISKASQKKL